MIQAERKTILVVTPEMTLPKLLVEKAARYGDRKVAMREKEFGIWRPITWKDYLENVKFLCLGLVELGLRPGDKVAIIGDNRPEWVWAELAALSAGGIVVGLYQDSLLDEVLYIIDHSDSTFVIGEGQEEVDKFLAIKSQVPKVKRLVWDDPKGMRRYDDPSLISLAEVHSIGKRLDNERPGLFEDMVARGKGEDTALLFYTSGTAALPKGALLSHFNLLKMAQNLMAVDPRSDEEEFVSFLPLAWIGEQMMSVSCGLSVGLTVNMPEEPETARENIREVAPHAIFAPPRIWESMVRETLVKIEDSTFLKRFLYRRAMNVGYRLADCKFARKPTPWWLRWAGKLSYWLVYRPVVDDLGLIRVRHAYTGGAALGPDQFRFFHALGVNLKQIYGQTEISGISVLHRDDDIKFDTCGKPIPETDVTIADTGEICSRSPCVFKGYYKMPEETARTLREGWLHSGDSGYIEDNGHLVVIDRSKDVMVALDGSKVSPQYLENKLKFSPFIKDAMVIGHQRPFVTAIICVDYGTVGKWAEDRNIPYTSYQELSQKPEVYDLVQKQVVKVNSSLPRVAKIHKFVNLYKEFDADDDELTRTRKLRRAFVEERYRDVIEALYCNEESCNIRTTITYEDGRTKELRTVLKMQPVPQER